MPATPGPWAYDPDTSHIISTTAFEDWSLDLPDEEPVPKRVLCLISAMGGDDSQADLALLVAAPKLLRALHAVIDGAAWAHIDPDALRQAREAIEHAEGVVPVPLKSGE
jgi:hypothetical protein